MKLFVTGVAGQLGHDVVNEALNRGHEVCGSDIHPSYHGVADGSPVNTCAYRSLDITDGEAVKALITGLRPDAIIHCAAWTNVDGAEDPANRPKVYAINADGTKYIAQAAGEIDCKIGVCFFQTRLRLHARLKFVISDFLQNRRDFFFARQFR